MGNSDGLIDRALEWVVVWVLLTSGLGLLATLVHHFMAPQVCLAATFLTLIYARWMRPQGFTGVLGPKRKHMVLLILVCLFFRLPAFNHVPGGQDEGVYVNLAHQIERTGSLVVWDKPLQKLQGTPFVERYLAENRVVYADPSSPDAKVNTGAYVGGVYVRSVTGDNLYFQFYPLFPTWMALFAGIFGSAFAVYALTFFALLSVIFMYRLALVLTGSTRAALVAGLLLAVNPLHAFFSKFPVTEVPTLAFSLMGFTYLAMFWRAGHGTRSWRWLMLSVLSFGALFMTRISGFMYVPFFIAMAVATATNDADRPRRRRIQFWVLGVAALYLISVGYGLRWTHQYAVDIYRASFEHFFPRHWRVGLAVLVLLILILWSGLVALARTDMRPRMDRYIVAPLRRAVAPVILLGLAAGMFKIYQLGWTSHYQGDAWLDTWWGLAGSHWRAVRASSLAAFFVYLGPVLPLAFLGLALRREQEPRIEFLRFFTAGFFVYIVLLQWTVPYGPYYARYLLSEAVPYMLLFTVLVWARMPRGSARRVLNAVLAITLIYSTAATACQLGKTENVGLYQSLTKLLAPIDSGDVVLLDTLAPGSPDNNELKTPIVFTFGLNAVTVSKTSLGDLSYLATLNARYDDVFLISQSALAPPGFDSLGSSRFVDKRFEWSHSFPDKFYTAEDTQLYLYRLSHAIFPIGHPQPFGAPGAWNDWLVSGWSAPEPGGVWSEGPRAELAIDPRQLSRVVQGMRLDFAVYGLVTATHPRQRIDVTVNGVDAGKHVVVFPNNQMQFSVTVPASGMSSSNKVHVAFDLPDATSPQSIGMNSDARVLGIQLQTLTVSPLAPGGELPPAPPDDPGKTGTHDNHKSN